MATRTRNYATIVYPESAPENWMQILEDHMIPCCISPLHDKDVNPTGEQKKAHYHVLIAFDGVKTVEQAKVVIDSIGGVGIENVQSIRGYTRYLCHLDNPDKFQYDTALVRSLCGFDFTGTIGLATDKYKAIREIVEYCEEYNITSYRVLFNYAMYNRYDWFRVLCDNSTIVVKEYLRAKFWDGIENE